MLFKEEIICKDSKMKIIADKKGTIAAAFDEIKKQRALIENYINKNPEFLSSLKPIKVEKGTPKIVREMVSSSQIASVGPMGAVAGAIAEAACRRMIREGAETALVENGGDIFAIAEKPIRIGFFAGKNKMLNDIGFKLNSENTPLGICSSSSLMGHSLSFGNCDLATVFAKSAAIADAFATATANIVKEERDIEAALNWLGRFRKVKGAIIAKRGRIGLTGEIPNLIPIRDKALEYKVTSFQYSY